MTKINLFIMILVVLVSCNKNSELESGKQNKSSEIVSDSIIDEEIDLNTLTGEHAFIEAIEIISDLGDTAYYDRALPSGLSNISANIDFRTEEFADLEYDLNVEASKLFNGNSGSNRVDTHKAYLTEGEYVSYMDAYNFTGKVLVDIKDSYPNAKFYYVDLYYNNLISPRLIAKVTVKY